MFETLRVFGEPIGKTAGVERHKVCPLLYLSFSLWKKLRTTNAIEGCFVEVRHRTRPRAVFTNIQSLDQIICAVFQCFNKDWQNHTLKLSTQRT